MSPKINHDPAEENTLHFVERQFQRVRIGGDECLWVRGRGGAAEAGPDSRSRDFLGRACARSDVSRKKICPPAVGFSLYLEERPF